MEEHALKYMNTKIIFYLKTSGGQKYNLFKRSDPRDSSLSFKL